MKERPIIFSGEMVRALLDSRKTQTRRVVKRNAAGRVELSGRQWHIEDLDAVEACPYGRPPQVTRKPIPICPDYEAGDDGNIYRRGASAPLKHWMGGYQRCYRMVSAGAMRKAYVHRLVCEAFYGAAPPEFPEVRHLNGATQDNRPQNLDWGTKEQNAADRSAHGRASHGNHGSSKLTTETVAEIRADVNMTRPALAEKYRVSKGTIDDIIDGRTWLPLSEQPPANFPRYVPEQPGDRLWVREAFRSRRVDGQPGDVTYRADHPGAATVPGSYGRSWKPSIHMPRWASRILLEVTAVRVERLHDISQQDAAAEGWPGTASEETPAPPLVWFRRTWEKINGDDAWDANPWVWVVEFRRIEQEGRIA